MPVHVNTLRQLRADPKLPQVFETVVRQATQIAGSAEFLSVNTLRQKYGSGEQGLFDTYGDLIDEVMTAMAEA